MRDAIRDSLLLGMRAGHVSAVRWSLPSVGVLRIATSPQKRRYHPPDQGRGRESGEADAYGSFPNVEITVEEFAAAINIDVTQPHTLAISYSYEHSPNPIKALDKVCHQRVRSFV